MQWPLVTSEHKLVQIVCATLLFFQCLSLPSHAEREVRPFWTEKSAFVEGDDLFVVGVASQAKTPEEGRQLAFKRGTLEIMNFAQIKTLQTPGVLIETQMTYEEKNQDGSVTVFRLLRVSLRKLMEMQTPNSVSRHENKRQAQPEDSSQRKTVLENQARRVQEVLDNHKKVCGHVTVGMTKTEVRDLIGSPPAQPGPYPYFERNNIWPYENSWIKFNENDIVQSLIGC